MAHEDEPFDVMFENTALEETFHVACENLDGGGVVGQRSVAPREELRLVLPARWYEKTDSGEHYEFETNISCFTQSTEDPYPSPPRDSYALVMPRHALEMPLCESVSGCTILEILDGGDIRLRQ